MMTKANMRRSSDDKAPCASHSVCSHLAHGDGDECEGEDEDEAYVEVEHVDEGRRRDDDWEFEEMMKLKD